MTTCLLCGEPTEDRDSAAEQALGDLRRVEVVNRPDGRRLASFHPRCWELLDGVVKAMIRMARFPELKEALAK